MAKRKTVPLGRAIRWTAEQEKAEADPTPANISKWTQEVINGWVKYAKVHKNLINAKVKQNG